MCSGSGDNQIKLSLINISTARLMNHELWNALHAWLIWEDLLRRSSCSLILWCPCRDQPRGHSFFRQCTWQNNAAECWIGPLQCSVSVGKVGGGAFCWCNCWLEPHLHALGLLVMINSGDASKRTALCQRAPERRRARLKIIRVRGSRLLLCCVFYICPLAGSRQTLLSTPQLWT